MVKVVSLA